MVLLKIWQISQENSYAVVPFLSTFGAASLQLYRKEALTRTFKEHLRTTVPDTSEGVVEILCKNFVF